MTTNSQPQSITSNVCLHMSIELAAASWKLGFADQLGRNPRIRSIKAGDLLKLRKEIAAFRHFSGKKNGEKQQSPLPLAGIDIYTFRTASSSPSLWEGRASARGG